MRHLLAASVPLKGLEVVVAKASLASHHSCAACVRDATSAEGWWELPGTPTARQAPRHYVEPANSVTLAQHVYFLPLFSGESDWLD